jgi:hypothetical protein
MSITAVGNLGTNGLATSNTTVTLATGIALTAMDWILVHATSSNTSTTDGDNSEVTSVTDTRGHSYVKVGEYTNSNGVAGTGLTVSLWRTQVVSDIVAGDLTITFTYASARANKAISGHVFRSSTLSDNIIFNTPVTPDATDASNDFGSVAHAGATGTNVIYYRALGKTTNSTTQLTPSTDFTAVTNIRSSSAAAARCAYGEFVIQDSLGKTSNPTLAVSGDTAGVFVAIAEGTDTDGETRLTQEHAIVIHGTDETPIRMTQQHAIVVHGEANTPARLTQMHMMVIHSRPPTRRTTWMGSWI